MATTAPPDAINTIPGQLWATSWTEVIMAASSVKMPPKEAEAYDWAVTLLELLSAANDIDLVVHSERGGIGEVGRPTDFDFIVFVVGVLDE